MYVPSERNLLSVFDNAFSLRDMPENLFTFAEELRKAQLSLGGEHLPLPN